MPQITTPRTVTATSTPRQTLTTILPFRYPKTNKRKFVENKIFKRLNDSPLSCHCLPRFGCRWWEVGEGRGGRCPQVRSPSPVLDIYNAPGMICRHNGYNPVNLENNLHNFITNDLIWFTIWDQLEWLLLSFELDFFLSLLTCNKCRLRHGRWHTPLERAWAEHRVRIIEESIVLSNKKY